MAEMEELRQRLQKHLLLIRRCVGWTATEFGARIGVSRQTINYLEANKNDKYKLSTTQYLAIRKVLDDEIRKSKSNGATDMDMVILILEVLIDNPEKYSSEERQNVISKANLLAPSILAKSSTRQEVSDDFETARTSGLLGNTLKAVSIGAIFALSLLPFFKDSNDVKEE